jgi:protein SCO1/2
MKSLLCLFAALTIAVTTAGCSTNKNGAATTTSASISTAHDTPQELTPAGPSIYPLSVALRDQHDRAIGIDAFRGHPVVISMFYGSCPTACPLLVSNVKRIEESLPADVRQETRVLLVSFDPAHDTPAVLAFIAKGRELDDARWTLATASDDDVRQIAAVLGISYRARPEGGFVHDSVLTVLDREGRIVARTDESDEENLAKLTRAITTIAR